MMGIERKLDKSDSEALKKMLSETDNPQKKRAIEKKISELDKDVNK